MSGIVELLRSRRVPQVAVLTLMSVGFAGCSGDMSTRFSQNSYSNNPFAFEPQATGSVAAAPSPQAAAPSPQVERRELPQYARPQSPYQSSALPPPAVSAPQSYPAANAGVSGGGRGLASYSPPPAQPKLETTGTVPPRSAATAHNAAAQGGTTIIATRGRARYRPVSSSLVRVRPPRRPSHRRPASQLRSRLPPQPCMSSTRAIPCLASRVATTCRWPNSRRPTIWINRPGSDWV